jgi:hypothetical protein
MRSKKERTEQTKDGIKMLKSMYAKWKKQQSLNKRIDYEEYLVDEVDELDLDDQRQWQN